MPVLVSSLLLSPVLCVAVRSRSASRRGWCAVVRKTRSGQILGPDQRLSVYEALRAVTYNSAWAYGEEDRKGTLEPGKLADMIVVSSAPFAIDPDEIQNIEVLETWKEGKKVYDRSKASAEGA